MDIALPRHSVRPSAAFTPATGSSPKLTPVIAWMVLAIIAVAALGYWDEQRESVSALNDFEHEQVTLARAVSAVLMTELRESAPDDGASDAALIPAHVLDSLRQVEEPGSILVLTRPPRSPHFLTTDRRVVTSTELDAAVDRGARSAQLSRAAAAELGLPARTAVVGFEPSEGDASARWNVAVVATAERGRDREVRAGLRLLLGVGVASGLVLAFGGLALRKQRKQLELSRALAIAAIAQERDERLVRADKLATMGALATGIAHEVSTPLGVIVGRADQLVAKLADDPRATRAINDILEQSERITRVMRGFLTIARGDSPLLERVNPEDVARKSIDLVEHRFAKARVRLTCDIAPRLPVIACEPRLLEQAIVNLLLNACDASDATDPESTVDLRVRADGERVAFVVTDRGSGISPEVALRATDPFFTTKPKGEGTGLGLAIANEIIKHHNGTLTLQTRETDAARGTRACLEIPTASEAFHE